MASEVVAAPLSAAGLETVVARPNAAEVRCLACGANFVAHKVHCGARVACRECGIKPTGSDADPFGTGLALGDDVPRTGL